MHLCLLLQLLQLRLLIHHHQAHTTIALRLRHHLRATIAHRQAILQITAHRRHATTAHLHHLLTQVQAGKLFTYVTSYVTIL
jgi:hypothetical protein